MTISVQAIIEYISYFFQASVIRLMPLRIYMHCKNVFKLRDIG